MIVRCPFCRHKSDITPTGGPVKCPHCPRQFYTPQPRAPVSTNDRSSSSSSAPTKLIERSRIVASSENSHHVEEPSVDPEIRETFMRGFVWGWGFILACASFAAIAGIVWLILWTAGALFTSAPETNKQKPARLPIVRTDDSQIRAGNIRTVLDD